MTIKPCLECGNQVSDKADKCPHCGVEIKKKTPLLAWFFIAALVLFIFAQYNREDVSQAKNDIADSSTRKANKAGDVLFIAQQQIRMSAKDPDSIQFRGEQLHEYTDIGALACGQYNAKNSFGAYVGFKGYVAVYDEKKLYVEDTVHPKDFIRLWNKYCVSK